MTKTQFCPNSYGAVWRSDDAVDKAQNDPAVLEVLATVYSIDEKIAASLTEQIDLNELDPHP